jgi:ribosomal protein S27AE
MFKMKESKIQTPDWIKEGYDSPAEYAKAKGLDSKKKVSGKVYKIKKCPKCGSNNVKVVLSGSDSEEETNTGNQWQCGKCKWTGEKVKEEEVDEDTFLDYMEKMGDEK